MGLRIWHTGNYLFRHGVSLRRVVCVTFSLFALAAVVGARTAIDVLVYEHPWDFYWDIWMSTVVLTSMFVGAVIRDLWNTALRAGLSPQGTRELRRRFVAHGFSPDGTTDVSQISEPDPSREGVYTPETEGSSRKSTDSP